MTSDSFAEEVRGDLRMDGVALGRAEDQIVRGVRIAAAKSLLNLRCAMRLQHRDGGGVKGDGPTSSGCLGRSPTQARVAAEVVACLDERAVDRDATSCQVNIVPTQAKRLTST